MDFELKIDTHQSDRFFLHSRFTRHFVIHFNESEGMKGSLVLPIEARRSSSRIFVPVLDTEGPVEANSPRFIESPTQQSSLKESEIERKINDAVLNAEINRRRSTDSIVFPTSSSDEDEGKTRRRRSVTFGNESDVEYDEEGGTQQFKTIVRLSKEFDGNRSGRRSGKQ
jgi:hypothetical protein